MTRILLLAGVFAFGAIALPAHAEPNGASSALCKKHKKKHHGKKKATKAATPVKAPSSNI